MTSLVQTLAALAMDVRAGSGCLNRISASISGACAPRSRAFSPPATSAGIPSHSSRPATARPWRSRRSVISTSPDPLACRFQPACQVSAFTHLQRYAVHKLIVSRRRRAGSAKRQKDIRQSAGLLDVLAQKRPYELKTAWKAAYQVGKTCQSSKTWRALLGEGLSQLPAATRDLTLKVVEERREIATGMNLTFNRSAPTYDSGRELVRFAGEALGTAVRCAISEEALDDHFGNDGTSGRTNEERLETVRKSRSAIERLARHKYLFWPVEEMEAVMIETQDVPKLLKETAGRAGR